MSDGLAGYLTYPKEKHGVCWVHAVRKFKMILKENPKNLQAAKVVAQVSKLFTIEQELRTCLHEGSLDPQGFLTLRREKSQNIIDSVFEEVDGFRSDLGVYLFLCKWFFITPPEFCRGTGLRIG
jgi:hypothetical protein